MGLILYGSCKVKENDVAMQIKLAIVYCEIFKKMRRGNLMSLPVNWSNGSY